VITVITGVPGAGKSYKAVKGAVTRLAEGRPQYANFAFRFENVERWLRLRKRFTRRQALASLRMIHEVRNYEDMFNMFGHETCDLTIDEAPDWFPSREHTVLPHEFLTFWRQHRKGGIDAILIAQNLSGLDSQIRSYAGEIFVARPANLFTKIMSFPKTLNPKHKIIRYVQTLDSSMDGIENKPQGFFNRANKIEVAIMDYLIASCYDNKEMFPSPFAELKRVKDPKYSEMTKKIGIAWDAAKLKAKRRNGLARDGLPFLDSFDVSDDALINAKRLRELLQDHEAFIKEQLTQEFQAFRELYGLTIESDEELLELNEYGRSGLIKPVSTLIN
jgi:hypothetical protein